MNLPTFFKNINLIKHENISNSLVILFILYFCIFSGYLAFNLELGSIPDEVAHFEFSNHFSTTWGIPPDTAETYIHGWYIKQNPFLNFWINGRIINILNFAVPSLSNLRILIILRLINIIYSLGTVLFCYLLSKELIRNKRWQFLPVFLITNTFMIVLLASGVSYDNLTNLLSIAGIYFLVRVFNQENFTINSLAWMICISLGTLTKETVLPLALGMGLAWIAFLFKYQIHIFPIKLESDYEKIFALILLLLIIANLALYGYNLLKYQAFLPPCRAILSQEQCALSPFYQRLKQYGLEQKPTLIEAIRQRYPGPIKFFITMWLPNMISRIFGADGHELIYFSKQLTNMHIIIYVWVILVTIFSNKKWIFRNLSLVGIFLFYALVLFTIQYDAGLTYGFKDVILHGRYMFPVIGIAYVLLSKMIINIPKKIIRIPTLVLMIEIYLFSGPIYFLPHLLTTSDWFVK